MAKRAKRWAPTKRRMRLGYLGGRPVVEAVGEVVAEIEAVEDAAPAPKKKAKKKKKKAKAKRKGLLRRRTADD